MNYELNDLLELMVDQGASDLHLQVKQPPTLRVSGGLVPVEGPPLDAEDTLGLMRAITSPKVQDQLKTTGGADFAFSYRDSRRFRVSLLRSKGNVGLVLRQIPEEMLSLAEIGLPNKIKELRRIHLASSLLAAITPNPCGEWFAGRGAPFDTVVSITPTAPLIGEDTTNRIPPDTRVGASGGMISLDAYLLSHFSRHSSRGSEAPSISRDCTVMPTKLIENGADIAA